MVTNVHISYLRPHTTANRSQRTRCSSKRENLRCLRLYRTHHNQKLSPRRQTWELREKCPQLQPRTYNSSKRRKGLYTEKTQSRRGIAAYRKKLLPRRSRSPCSLHHLGLSRTRIDGEAICYLCIWLRALYVPDLSCIRSFALAAAVAWLCILDQCRQRSLAVPANLISPRPPQ